MPAQYPGAVTTLPGTSPTNLSDTVGGKDHPARHDQVELEINAITGELGVNPKGVAASVKARLDTIDESVGTIEDTLLDAKGSDASLPARLDRMQGEIDGASSKVIAYEYTSGTTAWTRPAGALWVEYEIIAAGGGGASGSVAPAGTGIEGGGGGAPGAIIRGRMSAAQAGANGNAVVGAPGAGGAGRTTNFGHNAGANGGNSSIFGITAVGGLGATTSSGASGSGVIGASSLADDIINGPGGANGGSGTGSSVGAITRLLPTGGGGGGGKNSANTAFGGGEGGDYSANALGWPTTGATGGTLGGGNGAAGVEFRGVGLGGGGGGGAVGTTNGGAGGAGATPGGGGGGGGACQSGATSGPGGGGGGGRIRVVWIIA